MISFNLKCPQGQEFEGWFGSSGDYDSQRERGLVSCPVCSATDITKALMTPNVAAKSNSKPVPTSLPAKTANFPPAMTPEQQQAGAEILAELRKLQNRVESECDYVGNAFAEEARKIHYGEADPRGIYGQTSQQEAEDLADEGIAVARIPWLPKEQ
jgi:hypothetical protein